MSALNYANAEAFISSIPDGCWTSFKDVATVAGNPDAAMPIGNWLRESGGSIHKYWRVLRSDGYIPDGFVSHAPGLPHDAVSERGVTKLCDKNRPDGAPPTKTPRFGGFFLRAAEGTRTLDLLHGKPTTALAVCDRLWRSPVFLGRLRLAQS